MTQTNFAMATTHTIRDDEIPKLTDLIKKSPPRVTSEKRSVSSTAESKRETYAEKYSDLERTQTNGSGSEGKVPSGELHYSWQYGTVPSWHSQGYDQAPPCVLGKK